MDKDDRRASGSGTTPIFNAKTGKLDVLPSDQAPVEEIAPIGHGHFGGLAATISVGEAIALGVAGNIAYQALVSAVGRYRRRIANQRAKAGRLRREEVFDVAVGALRIANEVCLRPYQLDRAVVVLVTATENAAGDWNVVLGMRWSNGHTTNVWVDVPAGDLATATIQVDGCEDCRTRRLRRHR